MAIVVNGTTLGPCQTVVVNGVYAEQVIVNGVLVHQNVCVPPGDIIFDMCGNTSWTTPIGYDTFSVCMIGAGGGGGIDCTAPNYGGPGGYAGNFLQQTLNTPGGTHYNLSIGCGYRSVSCGVPVNGSATVFGGLWSAAGGQGGYTDGYNKYGYLGNGGSRNLCGFTSYDGLTKYGEEDDGPGCMAWDMSGGQAGFMGDGGDGGHYMYCKESRIISQAQDGYRGGGGGGSGPYSELTNTKGGDGVIRVSWGTYNRMIKPFLHILMYQEELFKFGIINYDENNIPLKFKEWRILADKKVMELNWREPDWRYRYNVKDSIIKDLDKRLNLPNLYKAKDDVIKNYKKEIKCMI